MSGDTAQKDGSGVLKEDGRFWRRMLFKGNKVYVEVDQLSRPVVKEGRVTIRYRPDDTREYRASVGRIAPLDSEACRPGADSAGTVDDPTVVIRPTASSRQSGGAVSDDRPGGRDSKGMRGAGVPRKPLNGQSENVQNTIVIYTDGACSGNPGPAGAGVLLRHLGREREISRYIGMGTNNVAELTAVKIALEAVKRRDLPILLFTDSRYVYGLLSKGWKAKANRELVEAIRSLISRFSNLRFKWVEGHAGDPGNERVDRLAREAIQGRNHGS